MITAIGLALLAASVIFFLVADNVGKTSITKTEELICKILLISGIVITIAGVLLEKYV